LPLGFAVFHRCSSSGSRVSFFTPPFFLELPRSAGGTAAASPISTVPSRPSTARPFCVPDFRAMSISTNEVASPYRRSTPGAAVFLFLMPIRFADLPPLDKGPWRRALFLALDFVVVPPPNPVSFASAGIEFSLAFCHLFCDFSSGAETFPTLPSLSGLQQQS